MLTFENFTKSGYLAYTLTAKSRNDLLQYFRPKYPEVIASHITYKFPAKSTDELPPEVHEAHVVGYDDSGDGIEAAVVEINGSTKKSDGDLYHITISLDPSKHKPFHSRDLVKKNFTHVSPIAIHLIPAFLRHGQN